ncbi:MAG: small ribosomal subunit Rsm22 family protein, partial [Treponema sp.]|nr:small ribosomal subunit Rsm22 family protein [Treponema sp.]
MNLFAPLSGETASALAGIPGLIDGIFPLPRRFRFNLPKDIAELSRLLTSGRGERGFSYLGRPNLLSAYLRFYLPWNLYRLCRLLPGLDLELAPGDLVTDLGSGPFTLASALWISRMELRALPLEFQCVDRNGPALDAGGRFFRALAGESSPWKFRTFKGELGANRLRPAKLVCAANVFNEMYGDVSRSRGDALVRNAGKSARLLAAHADRNAAILVVEPGFPRCGEFLGLLRRALLESGHTALAPCPHDGHCPMLETPGTKRWCHFAFDTEDAPAKLKQLSLAAKLPKERAVASFL